MNTILIAWSIGVVTGIFVGVIGLHTYAKIKVAQWKRHDDIREETHDA